MHQPSLVILHESQNKRNLIMKFEAMKISLAREFENKIQNDSPKSS